MRKESKDEHAGKNQNSHERDGDETERQDWRIRTCRKKAATRAWKSEDVTKYEPLEVIVVMVERVEEAEHGEDGYRDMSFPRAVPKRDKRNNAYREKEDALPPTELTNGRKVRELVDECPSYRKCGNASDSSEKVYVCMPLNVTADSGNNKIQNAAYDENTCEREQGD